MQEPPPSNPQENSSAPFNSINKQTQQEVKFTNSRDYYHYKYSDTLSHDNHISGATAINSKYSSNLPLVVKYCSKEWKALQQKKGQQEITPEQRQDNWFNFINCIGANFCATTEYPHFKECLRDLRSNSIGNGVNSSNNSSLINGQQVVSIESLANGSGVPQDHAKLSKEKKIECLQMMKSCISRIFPSTSNTSNGSLN